MIENSVSENANVGHKGKDRAYNGSEGGIAGDGTGFSSVETYVATLDLEILIPHLSIDVERSTGEDAVDIVTPVLLMDGCISCHVERGGARGCTIDRSGTIDADVA